jgi:DNA repair exonuclease SbcCD nuclease subunit
MFADTLRCLEYMVEDGQKSEVGLWLVGGDLSGTTVPHMMTTEERNALGTLFQKMAETAPVVILYGNHDLEDDLLEFGRLESDCGIIVVSEPSVFIAGTATVLAFPYPWKRHYLQKMEGAIEEQDRTVEGQLHALFAEWKKDVALAHTTGFPVVSITHATFRGSLLAGGEVIPVGQEIELGVEEIEALGAEYNGGSHMHLCQQLGPRTWYAGSPAAMNQGETDEKGYLVIDVERGQEPIVHRRKSPSRRFQTVDVKWSPETGIVWSTPLDEAVRDARVRIRLELAEDDVGAVPLEEIEAAARAAGAGTVKVEKHVLPKVRIRCEAIATAQNLGQKVAAYWESLNGAGPGPEQRERCLGKLGELEQAA